MLDFAKISRYFQKCIEVQIVFIDTVKKLSFKLHQRFPNFDFFGIPGSCLGFRVLQTFWATLSGTVSPCGTTGRIMLGQCP